VHMDIGSGSREWTGKGAVRRRVGKQHTTGRKQFSARAERNQTEYGNNRGSSR